MAAGVCACERCVLGMPRCGTEEQDCNWAAEQSSAQLHQQPCHCRAAYLVQPGAGELTRRVSLEPPPNV